MSAPDFILFYQFHYIGLSLFDYNLHFDSFLSKHNHIKKITIRTLTFRTITQASLPNQDAVIITFKMAFKRAAIIYCARA